MPWSPPRRCPACGAVVAGRCPCRPSWSTPAPLASRAWRKLRARVLLEQPICAWPDCPQLATIGDHILARGFGGAVLDRANVQGLCSGHHDLKSAAESLAARRGDPPPAWPPPFPAAGGWTKSSDG